MGTAEVIWEPPGPGMWRTVPDHFPKPVCRLFVELFPAMALGSPMGAKIYGVPAGGNGMRCASVNGWLYFGAGDPVDDDLAALDVVAKESLETKRWRREADEWIAVERPAVVAANLALQGEDVAAMDDAAMADHIRRAVAHYRAACPLHFAHQGWRYASGALLEACEGWGIDAEEVLELFVGAAGATRAASEHVEAIADALRQVGVRSAATLDDIRAGSAAAAVALGEYLRLHGLRLVENRDLVDPTLSERPELIVRSVDAALARAERRPTREPASLADVRSRVPAAERARFDELLDDARATYGTGDDDEGVCFLWTQGIIRRAVLEAGRRLTDRGVIGHPDELLDATTDEIDALLTGDAARQPAPGALAEHRRVRLRGAALTPPGQIGTDVAGSAPPPPVELPPNVARLRELAQRRWTHHIAPDDAAPLQGRGIGAGVHRGRVVAVTDAGDALDRLEPGDVLVAVATNPGFNAVFPIVGAVVTEEGGATCHAAVLARELGIPAVVGVGGIRELRDGQVVEVDAGSGTVRVVEG